MGHKALPVLKARLVLQVHLDRAVFEASLGHPVLTVLTVLTVPRENKDPKDPMDPKAPLVRRAPTENQES